ncbi:MAG: acyl carrier protein [Anaerolineales bacterium]|jgi:acyl carrier protein
MEEKLRKYIQDEILKDANFAIQSDEPLISSGLIDSFSLVDIALFVEGEFGIRIDDAELNADVFDTLSELTALIKDRQ